MGHFFFKRPTIVGCFIRYTSYIHDHFQPFPTILFQIDVSWPIPIVKLSFINAPTPSEQLAG
jgi:hypothetical protein